MKKKLLSTLIVLIIAGLSVAGGFLYTKIADNARRKAYPMLYAAEVSAAADEAGIQTEALYALVRVRSGFNQTAESDDGRMGLCMLSAEEYEKYAGILGENTDERLRWDPELNLRAGAEMLAGYFRKYEDWQAVFAAVKSGTDAADAAYGDKKTDLELLDTQTRTFVEECMEAMNKYITLYDISSSAQAANE